MSEQPHYGQIATHLRFENDDVRVWEMNLAPGQLCGLHRHNSDYVLYILEGGRIAVESPAMTSNRFPGKSTYELEVGSRAISYVPAGGAESARNVGSRRFREAIFEILRPLPAGISNPGFALTEAVTDLPPRPGAATLLENSRIRALEITVAPGSSVGPRAESRDAVVFVIDGGRISLRESRNAETNTKQVELAPSTVLWQPGGWERELINLGPRAYRDIRVEFR
jgi:Auxin binding protein